jgi:hypothetical protein
VCSTLISRTSDPCPFVLRDLKLILPRVQPAPLLMTVTGLAMRAHRHLVVGWIHQWHICRNPRWLCELRRHCWRKEGAQSQKELFLLTHLLPADASSDWGSCRVMLLRRIAVSVSPTPTGFPRGRREHEQGSDAARGASAMAMGRAGVTRESRPPGCSL